jgi:hypothetical protein
MVRILLVIMALVFAYSASAEAGWLEDKLKRAAESVGDRIINDTSDSAYEGAKDAVTPEDKETNSDSSGQYEAGEAAELEEQAEEYEEYADESELEEMAEPSWADSNYGQKPRKKKKAGPPRTDLYLSTEMIMNDPESSPEPFKGKLYIDGAKVRSEFDYPGGNSLGMIVTGIDPADKVYILMHKEKTYMESSQDDTDSFFFGSSKPCEGYHKAEDLGRTKFNGRSVTKWRCSEPEDPEDTEEAQAVITVWHDNKLKIPVRMEEGNGKGYWELQNIQEGRPSGDLFKVPAGYKMLAAGAIPTALSLPDQDEQLIESAGIPLYTKARFVYGNNSVGYRFASSEPVDNVRAWYRKQLSSWPVYEDKYGSWIIYKGKPGASMGDLIMKKTQVSVQKNDKLPEWHSLDKNMTTEIVVMVIE